MNTISFDDNWFILEVSMKLNNFFSKFKNPSHFYRCLSQGNWRFLKQSNRSFFRNFSSGMYRSVIDNEKVSIIFFLRVKNKAKIQSITRELTVRIKKLMNSPVKIYEISKMNSTDNKLMISKNGQNFYNKIFDNKEARNKNSVRVTSHHIY
jgi:hypothetical protein